MFERGEPSLSEPSQTAQRRRSYRLRAALTIGRAIATLVTIARPVDADSDRIRIASCLPPAPVTG
jgi:hypothetical protein